MLPQTEHDAHVRLPQEIIRAHDVVDALHLMVEVLRAPADEGNNAIR